MYSVKPVSVGAPGSNPDGTTPAHIEFHQGGAHICTAHTLESAESICHAAGFTFDDVKKSLTPREPQANQFLPKFTPAKQGLSVLDADVIVDSVKPVSVSAPGSNPDGTTTAHDVIADA